MERFVIFGRDHERLVWEDGEVSGSPGLLVDHARRALQANPQVALTETGPLISSATKRGAFIVLYALVEDVEEVIDAPPATRAPGPGPEGVVF